MHRKAEIHECQASRPFRSRFDPELARLARRQLLALGHPELQVSYLFFSDSIIDLRKTESDEAPSIIKPFDIGVFNKMGLAQY